MGKRKASLGLGTVLDDNNETEFIGAIPSVELKPETKNVNLTRVKKKQSIPIYVDPLLHEALHVLVFSERHKKTTFQTLFIDALDLLLKQRGLTPVKDLSSGDKTMNL